MYQFFLLTLEIDFLISEYINILYAYKIASIYIFIIFIIFFGFYYIIIFFGFYINSIIFDKNNNSKILLILNNSLV